MVDNVTRRRSHYLPSVVKGLTPNVLGLKSLIMSEFDKGFSHKHRTHADEAREDRFVKVTVITICSILALIFIFLVVSRAFLQQKNPVEDLSYEKKETPKEISILRSEYLTTRTTDRLNFLIDTCYQLETKHPEYFEELERIIELCSQRREELKKQDLENKIISIKQEIDKNEFTRAVSALNEALDNYRFESRLLKLHSDVVKKAWEYAVSRLQSLENSSPDERKKICKELVAKLGSDKYLEFAPICKWITSEANR